jgi:hypothetical protein
MINWKEYLIFILMLLLGFAIALVTEQEYTCINGKRYEVTKDMLIATGKECLPIDKD